MANNDDLDDFFKKKDRKTNKHKKQSGLLTNNQELLKQLEIVTSATTAFKENLDLDEDDEELPVHNELAVTSAFPAEEIRKHPIKSNKTKLPDHNHKQDQEIILSLDGPQQQQDEWEDFESSSDKYEQLRLKFASVVNDNDDEYYDDENNPHNNDDNSDLTGDRQQTKDKPAWKIDQIKKEQETKAPIVEENPEVVQPPKPATAATSGQSGAYRPPHARGGSSVTVITNVNNQRTTKKKEPNLSSIDEFPTLGAATNKK